MNDNQTFALDHSAALLSSSPGYQLFYSLYVY